MVGTLPNKRTRYFPSLSFRARPVLVYSSLSMIRTQPRGPPSQHLCATRNQKGSRKVRGREGPVKKLAFNSLVYRHESIKLLSYTLHRLATAPVPCTLCTRTAWRYKYAQKDKVDSLVPRYGMVHGAWDGSIRDLPTQGTERQIGTLDLLPSASWHPRDLKL